MSDIVVPRTPSPTLASLSVPKPAIAMDHIANDHIPTSPALQSAKELTPPPSSQVRKPMPKSPHPSQKTNPLASPPNTLNPTPNLKFSGLFGEVPTVEAVQNLNEEQLRGLLAEVLPALTEARMSAAHTRLQHNLLKIENEEYIKRSEVEQELARREVEVLQGVQGDRGKLSTSPRSPQAAIRRTLDLAREKCSSLQYEILSYENRLRKAKKCIKKLDGDNYELKKQNQELRERIRANRTHLEAMRSAGTISINGSPLPDFRTPLHRTPKTPATGRSTLTVNPVGSQDAFNALLQAGEVMSGEANSVPSTPTRIQSRKSHHSHIRGAHSMSSIPTTPNRNKPATAARLVTPAVQPAKTPRLAVPTPSAQLTYDEDERHRSSRDSTISASDHEDEAYDDDDIPASQASQQATNMLRRETVSAVNSRFTGSPALTQAKLYGQVKKPRYEVPNSSQKRQADPNVYGEKARNSKKAKLTTPSQSRVGLGIS